MNQTTHSHGYFGLPVLGGTEVNREPREFAVKIDNGRLVTVEGEALIIRPDTDVVGWGELDGPSYEIRVVSTFTGGVSPWYVSVNRDLLDKFAARHGVDLTVEAMA